MFEVQKFYHLLLDKAFTRSDMRTLLAGVEFEDGFIKVDEAHYFQDRPKNNLIVALHSGKYRIVRRLFEHLGYGVEKLDRAGYAGLTKARLDVGQ